MQIRYQAYSRNAIKADPQTMWVGPWKIDYLAFSQPSCYHKPPLLVIGGAFRISLPTNIASSVFTTTFR